MRDARVMQNEMFGEAIHTHCDLVASYGARLEMQCGETSVHRRVVILNSCRHA